MGVARLASTAGAYGDAASRTQPCAVCHAVPLGMRTLHRLQAEKDRGPERRTSSFFHIICIQHENPVRLEEHLGRSRTAERS